MKRAERFPVEPLSEQQWARVEERVFAAVDRMPRSDTGDRLAVSSRSSWGAGAWAAVACAAAVLALVVGQVLGTAGPSTGEPSALTEAPPPRALAQRERPRVAAEAPRERSEDSALPVAVETKGEPRELSVAGARIRMEPHTQLSYVAAHEGATETDTTGVGITSVGTQVELAVGGADFEVAPHPQRAPFVVQAGVVRVVVVGTAFQVRRDGEQAIVKVTRGTVRVESPAGQQLVRAGESWPGSASEPPSQAAPASAKPTPQRRSRRTARRSQGRTARKAKRSTAHAKLPQAQFEQAAMLEARDPQRADALYAEVARGNGVWAANALFGRARLHLEQQRTRSGTQLLKSYLRRFPDGPNAHDARQLLAARR